MTTKAKLTIKRLRTGNPWDIANDLGIHYSGDMNSIPHGGYYYETKNWQSNGYAEFVRFQESEGVLYVELGTVNRPDNIKPALNFIGMADDENSDSIHVEIEACMSYGHYDIGHAMWWRSDNSESWGEFPEFRIYQRALPHILNLASE